MGSIYSIYSHWELNSAVLELRLWSNHSCCFLDEKSKNRCQWCLLDTLQRAKACKNHLWASMYVTQIISFISQSIMLLFEVFLLSLSHKQLACLSQAQSINSQALGYLKLDFSWDFRMIVDIRLFIHRSALVCSKLLVACLFVKEFWFISLIFSCHPYP